MAGREAGREAGGREGRGKLRKENQTQWILDSYFIFIYFSFPRRTMALGLVFSPFLSLLLFISIIEGRKTTAEKCLSFLFPPALGSFLLLFIYLFIEFCVCVCVREFFCCCCLKPPLIELTVGDY